MDNSKDEKFYRLALYVLELEHTKGHLRWKVMDLVRKSKLSRTLIYRYLGNNKKDMLLTALDAFCSKFYGLKPDPAVKFSDKVAEARKTLIKYPEAAVFYQIWRSRPSFLQNEFIKIEAKFQKKLQSLLPGFTQSEIITIHALIHGLVTSPFLTPQQAKESCDYFLKVKISSLPS